MIQPAAMNHVATDHYPQSRGSIHNHSLHIEIIEISDDSHHSISSDSDGPVSNSRAQDWAAKSKSGRTQPQTSAIAITSKIEKLTASAANQHARPLTLTTRRRNIRIHDTDDEDQSATSAASTAPAASAASAKAATSSVSAASDAGHSSTASASAASASATARQKMHALFARFAGCQHGNMQVEQAPAPDADILDLRNAVPETFPLQFLDLESTHVPADSADSSGHTNSNTDSDDSSMIDDSNIMSTEEIEYLAKYVAKALPLTAKSLTSPPPLMTKSPKRNRVIPSSSSSPPAA
jgi:hypothetical protein